MIDRKIVETLVGHPYIWNCTRRYAGLVDGDKSGYVEVARRERMAFGHAGRTGTVLEGETERFWIRWDGLWDEFFILPEMTLRSLFPGPRPNADLVIESLRLIGEYKLPGFTIYRVAIEEKDRVQPDR